MPLTDREIRNIAPTSKRQRYFDERGLYLEVAPSGASGGVSSTVSPERKNGYPSAYILKSG